MQDEEIKKRIVDQLYWDGRIDASDIKVTVKNRTATLEGTVPSLRAKEAAIADAMRVPSVLTVDSRLKVAQTQDLPTDSKVSSDIERMLVSDPDIDESKIFAEMQDGHVILNGTVDNYWKKLLVIDIASSFVDDDKIKSHLSVVPTQSFKDEEISKSVMEALARNSLIDASKTEVSVKDGVVTLSGKVQSAMAKNEAEQIAGYTRGVKDVKNGIDVE